MEKRSFLSQIQGFDARTLTHTDTEVTTAAGKRFTERRDQTGALLSEPKAGPALGFCADYSPDYKVGVAMDRLLVGSQDVAHDFSVLKQHGITHILNVGYGIPNAFPDIEYKTEEMFDDFHENLAEHYPSCERFIDEGRQEGAVFVHCNAGVSRSVSIVLAYMMHKERIPLDAALNRLRQTRPSVQPNQSFLQQLQQMEAMLNILPAKDVVG